MKLPRKLINKCEKHFRASGVKLSLITVSIKMSSGTKKSLQDVTYANFYFVFVH